MPRRQAIVTQADIKRAVCAMISAGVKVYGVRVDAAGFTVITDPIPTPVSSGQASTDAAELDALLRGENGKG